MSAGQVHIGHVHILGICGTFMGGIALIAREAGFTVTGSDANPYPPMSTLLESHGVSITQGYGAEQLDALPDAVTVIVGNAMTRGKPVVEAMLDRGLRYTSGPQWLADTVLAGKWVLAVAGTHGKTTTTSMLTWILDQAGLEPGYLIGGVAKDFDASARLGAGSFFVIEADEYDTAFFDKRSKFVHYRPRTLVLNNLEFDHADIFPDLAAIQRQMHHVVRIVPGSGKLIVNGADNNLADTLAMGAWTPVEPFASDDGWHALLLQPDGCEFEVWLDADCHGTVRWNMLGNYNVSNALAAIAAARHVGVTPAAAIEALSRFGGVRRRQDVRGVVRGVTVYDDFAHHPTAIEATVAAVRARVGDARIAAIVEPRSNTMKLGHHIDDLAASLRGADSVWAFQPDGVDWKLTDTLAPLGERARVFSDVEALATAVTAQAGSGDHLLVMSNGGFGGIHQRLLTQLETSA